MNRLERLFHIKARGSSLKVEIFAGLLVFIATCYILPVNSSILSEMGMDESGVFFITAILSAFMMLLMGFIANYPIAISAGMGVNSFITYTLSLSLGFSWQETMIIATVAGLLFFIISLTPLRHKIINAIPRSLQAIIAASIGAFICFVGLKNSGIIFANSSTLVSLNTFRDPAVLIALVSVLLCFGLMLSKVRILKTLAIPLAILFAAVVGIIVSSIMIATGALVEVDGAYYYAESYFGSQNVMSNLPILPWLASDISFFDSEGIANVLFYGTLSSGESTSFANNLANVFTNPASYVAIITLVLVILFSSTGTFLAIGGDCGFINEEGQIIDRKPVIVEAVGSLIACPLGTSPNFALAESSVGLSMGAKTGVTAIVAALLFLLTGFIYPVFYIFTAGSVTAPALICIGALIFVNNIKTIDFKDLLIGLTAFITLIFTLLTYSISTGIGIGLIAYCLMMIFARRAKEVNYFIYIIAILYIISFVLTTVLEFL